ncbi:hypothetical protein [Rhodococcoides fascians]|uniref:hypothetical protein n=1 Tax=Rhodococcoides fascians TaxID=1828 RepID=UPI00050C36CA|nr:hypothetical protein [Rhodococcus fascians]
MSPRQWIAWRLVRLAHRIYDATWYQTVEVSGVEILIEADNYGGGIQMMYGDCDWKDHDTHEEALDYLCPEVDPVD